jgi:heme exporter protein D
MEHGFYIGMSYGITGLIVVALIGWVFLDGRARRKELAALEAAGLQRRSRAKPKGETA